MTSAPLPGSQQISISDQTPLEKAVGNWDALRFAWKLENVQVLSEPISCRGVQGLVDLAPDAIAQIYEQLESEAE